MDLQNTECPICGCELILVKGKGIHVGNGNGVVKVYKCSRYPEHWSETIVNADRQIDLMNAYLEFASKNEGEKED